MRLQHRTAAHDVVERRLAPLVDAIGVVHLPRAVETEPNQEVVLAEERCTTRRPAWCRWSGSCARCCCPGRRVLARPSRPSAGRTRAPSGSARRPARPTITSGSRLRLEQLPDVGFQQIVSHPEPAARVEHLLREEEAVLAIEIANRPRRLCQHVEVAQRIHRTDGIGCRFHGSQLWRRRRQKDGQRRTVDVRAFSPQYAVCDNPSPTKRAGVTICCEPRSPLMGAITPVSAGTAFASGD